MTQPLQANIASVNPWFTFKRRLLAWMVIWLLFLGFLFSGIEITIGSLQFKTLSLDRAFIQEWWPFISQGIFITFLLSVVSILCAVLLAFVSAIARLSKIAAFNSLSRLYTSLIRGTPLFLQFLFIYQALPQLGLVIDPFTSSVLALSLNYGAYMSEIFRAGIQAVGVGQVEAASACGFTPRQTMWWIVLPQAFRIIIPDIGNQFVAMPKDTALASAIALEELMGKARAAGLPRQHFFEALVIAARWYWLLTVILSVVQALLEHRLSRSDRNPSPQD